jgi:hypothetical protein
MAASTRKRSVTRQVGPLTLRAAVVPETIDKEKRTVQVIWTTGARVLRGFFETYWEELSLSPKHVRMGRLQSGASPVLDAHQSSELRHVIGVVESASLDEKEQRGIATLRFDSGPEATETFRKISDGIIRNISVGYNTYRMERVERAEGDESKDKTPVYRATDWEPYELSPVPVGADAGAVIRSAAITNPCEFTEEHRAMDEDETTEDTDTEGNTPVDMTVSGPVDVNVILADGATAAVDARAARAEDDEADDDEEDPPAERAAPKGARRAAATVAAAAASGPVTAERERVLGIQRVGKALRRPESEIQRAIAGGQSLNKFRAAAQDAFSVDGTINTSRSDPRVQPGADARDKWQLGAMAWLVQRSALTDVFQRAAKKNGMKFESDPGEFRGLTMLDLARQSLERGGVRTKGMSKIQLVGAALTQKRDVGGMASTGDFAILLENTLNKTMLAAYGTTPDTWSRFSTTGSVPDFRPSRRYRPGSFGALSLVNEHGEFPNQPIPDGTRESISAATKGNIIGITRQAIINDDMGAFTSLSTWLGRAARLSIELDVYALLALNGGLGPIMGDGIALFNAAHGNIGAPAALSVASLDADAVLMGVQKDPSNNEVLDIRPDILLVPRGLEGQAKVINQSQYDVDPQANGRFGVPNKVVGLFSDVVGSPRITGTRRYMFANPSIAPVIEVVFLDGQQSPYLEMQEGWRMDGVEWKVRLDYGVGAVDFRGALTNAGS